MVARYLSLLIVFFWACCLSAQENPVGISFDEAIEMAFRGDPGLEARNNAVSIGEYGIVSAKAKYFPRLNFYSNFTRTSLESEIELFNPATMSPESIKFLPENRYNFGLSLFQEIYTFGRRPAQKRAAEKAVRLSRIVRDEYERSIFDRTARAFITVLLTRDNIIIRKENVRRATEKLEIVNARIDEGLATEYDRIKAELLLARYQNDVSIATGEYRKAKSSLKALTNWDRESEFFPVGDLATFEIALPEKIRHDHQDRTDIKKLNLNGEIQEATMRVNRSAYFPSLGCLAKYDWQNGYQPDIDKIEGSWSLGISLNWLLFDGGERKSSVSRAQMEINRSSRLKEDLESYIESEIEKAEVSIESATEELTRARQRLALTDNGLIIAEAQYREGLLSISDLLDIELDRSETKLTLNRALFKLAMARLDLKVAIGYYPGL